MKSMIAKMKGILLIWAVCVFLCPLLASASEQVIEAVAVDVKGKEEYTKAYEVLDLINEQRTAAGLEALTMDVSLLDTAMLRAMECAVYCAHTRPNSLSAFSANELMYGENIAYGQDSAQEVVSVWMNSPGHRENILTNEYKSIGIGCVKISGILFWVQCFGIEQTKEASASAYSDREITRTIIIRAEAPYFSPGLDTGIILKVGERYQAQIYMGYAQLENANVVLTSSDTSVCVINGTVITAVGSGTAKISMYFPGYEKLAIERDIEVYQPQQLTLTLNANGGKLSNGKSKDTVKLDYRVTIDNVSKINTYGNLEAPVRKGYFFTGWYTNKNGEIKIKSTTKLMSKETQTLYAHWKKVKTGQAAISSAANASGRKLKVSWKKVTGANGYQVVCAANKKFTKGKQTLTVTKQSAVFKNLKKKTYYVKVRAYKVDSTGTKVYGKYSSVKKVKITK